MSDGATNQGSPRTATSFWAQTYDDSQSARWNQFVASARNGTFLFDRNYMDYHADRFEDASLLLWRGKRLIALLPASRHGDEVVSHGGLTYGGLLLGPKTSGRATLVALATACQALRQTGARSLRLKPVPAIYHRLPAEDELYAIHRLGGVLVRRDLASALRPQAPGPRSKGRTATVKAALRRDDISLQETDDFGPFMAMEAELLAAKYGTTPTHTAAELQRLAALFPRKIKLYVATIDGVLVAGTVIYVSDQVAHAQYIASTDQGRACGALDALQQHLIFTVFVDKPWFDFGISTESQGRVLNEGLCANKESWGARGVIYDHYAIDLAAPSIDAVLG